MAHICGYCWSCLERFLRQPNSPPIEARGTVAIQAECCSCGRRAPTLYGAAAADTAIAVPVAGTTGSGKNHGKLPAYPGELRT